MSSLIQLGQMISAFRYRKGFEHIWKYRIYENYLCLSNTQKTSLLKL